MRTGGVLISVVVFLGGRCDECSPSCIIQKEMIIPSGIPFNPESPGPIRSDPIRAVPGDGRFKKKKKIWGFLSDRICLSPS